MPKLLYIDDDEASLLLMEEAAKESKKFDVDTFSDGDKALDHLKTFNPSYDAAVVDLNLAGSQSGLHYIKELRKLFPTLPIAVLSSYDAGFVQGMTSETNIQIWQKSEVNFEDLTERVCQLINC